MTTPIAAQTTSHSSAFSVNKALQGRHKGGHVAFALPAAASQAPAKAAPAAASQATQPVKQAANPGNFVTHPLVAQLAAQSGKTPA